MFGEGLEAGQKNRRRVRMAGERLHLREQFESADARHLGRHDDETGGTGRIDRRRLLKSLKSELLAFISLSLAIDTLCRIHMFSKRTVLRGH